MSHAASVHPEAEGVGGVVADVAHQLFGAACRLLIVAREVRALLVSFKGRFI